MVRCIHASSVLSLLRDQMRADDYQLLTLTTLCKRKVNMSALEISGDNVGPTFIQRWPNVGMDVPNVGPTF